METEYEIKQDCITEDAEEENQIILLMRNIGLWVLVIALGLATGLIWYALPIAAIIVIEKFCHNDLF